MSYWKVILATMVIFGTGVVTGGLLVRQTQRPAAARALRPPSPPRPAPSVTAGVMRLEFIRRAERELDLTPEQRERADRLIKESQDRSRRIMEPVAPDLRKELARTKQDFMELLTPDQRQRFAEMLKRPSRQHDQRHPPVPAAPAGNSATNPAPAR